MMNQAILVGRLKEINNNTITIEVTDTDGKKIKCFIDMSDTILKNVREYVHHDDILGIRCKVGDQNTLIADKVTFLSSRNNEEGEENDD